MGVWEGFEKLLQSPAWLADYFFAANLHESYEGRDTTNLFLLNFCGHRWLENGAAIKRLLEIWGNMKKYFI